MAKPRGLYTPVYASLPGHEKVLAAARELHCDRVKLVGHLVCLWTWRLSSSQDGKALTPDTIAYGASWPKQSAQRFVEALADVGFLDRVDGGYAVHEWGEYGGKVASIQRYDRDRHAPKPVESTEEVPRNLPGNSPRDETRRDETETREDEKKRSDPQNPPTPRKRGQPVDEDFIQALVQEWAGTFAESRVRDEVERALNSVASKKWIDQRRGVKGWLRRAKQFDDERAPRQLRPRTYAGQEASRKLDHGAYSHLVNR